MYKYRILASLLVLLCFLAASLVALGEDRVLFSYGDWEARREQGESESGEGPFVPSSLSFAGDTLFILGFVYDVDLLYRYTLGEGEPTLVRTFEAACGCQFANASEMSEKDTEEWSSNIWCLTRGDQAMAFNWFTWRLGTLGEDGVAWHETPLDFPEDAPVMLDDDYDDGRIVRDVFLQGDTVVLAAEDAYTQQHQFYLFDRQTGAHRGNPLTVPRFSLLSPYQENSVVGLRYSGDDHRADLVALDPGTGEETVLASLLLSEDQVVTGLCWLAEEDALYYAVYPEVYRLRPGGEPEVVASLPPLQDGSGHAPAIALSPTQYALLTSEGVILRDMSTPPAAPSEAHISQQDAMRAAEDTLVRLGLETSDSLSTYGGPQFGFSYREDYGFYAWDVELSRAQKPVYTLQIDADTGRLHALYINDSSPLPDPLVEPRPVTDVLLDEWDRLYGDSPNYSPEVYGSERLDSPLSGGGDMTQRDALRIATELSLALSGHDTDVLYDYRPDVEFDVSPAARRWHISILQEPPTRGCARSSPSASTRPPESWRTSLGGTSNSDPCFQHTKGGRPFDGPPPFFYTPTAPIPSPRPSNPPGSACR